MRTCLFTLASLVTLSLTAPAPALADGAAERRVQAWIQRLKTDPVARRRLLLREIRDEACGDAGHPPVRVSDRTDVLPVLAVALDDADEAVREQAIATLCYMKNKEALPLLTRALTSEDAGVRYFACMGLGWLGDDPDARERAVAALRAARDRADEPWFNVRLHAAAALLDLGASREEDVALFLTGLRDPAANPALAAAALAQLGHKESVQLMITRLRTAVPSLDHHLSLALKVLTGQDHGKNAEAWQRWLDANRASLPEQVQ